MQILTHSIIQAIRSTAQFAEVDGDALNYSTTIHSNVRASVVGSERLRGYQLYGYHPRNEAYLACRD